MIKWYKKHKENEEIRLKYERLQCLLGKILKAKTGMEIDKLGFGLFGGHRDMTWSTEKKVRRLLDTKRQNLMFRYRIEKLKEEIKALKNENN